MLPLRSLDDLGVDIFESSDHTFTYSVDVGRSFAFSDFFEDGISYYYHLVVEGICSDYLSRACGVNDLRVVLNHADSSSRSLYTDALDFLIDEAQERSVAWSSWNLYRGRGPGGYHLDLSFAGFSAIFFGALTFDYSLDWAQWVSDFCVAHEMSEGLELLGQFGAGILPPVLGVALGAYLGKQVGYGASYFFHLPKKKWLDRLPVYQMMRDQCFVHHSHLFST